MKKNTKNKLNTPYRSNVEFARKGKQKSGDDFEFGNEARSFDKDSNLARGANIADAFSYPGSINADTGSRNQSLRNSRRQRSHDLNVEFSDDKESCCQDCAKNKNN